MSTNRNCVADFRILLTSGLLVLFLVLPFGAQAALTDFSEKLEAIKQDRNFATEDMRLKALLDVLYGYSMTEFPEQATNSGYPGQNDRWTDWSQVAVDRRKQETRTLLATLQKIKRSKLSPASQLDYDLVSKQLIWDVESQQYQEELLALNQLQGVQQDIARMMTMTPAARQSDYEDIIKRLNAAPALIDQTVALLQHGLAQGITAPKIPLRDVPQQVRNQLTDEPLESPILAAFKKFPATFSPGEQKKLRASATAVYRNEIAPAYKRLLHFLENDYLPRARDSIGANDLPKGDSWYQFKAMRSTTTSLTPAQIHQIGLNEVKRIRTAMDNVIKDSGFEGSFAEFSKFLRTDARFYFSDKNQLLLTYRDIAKRADPQLIKLFGTLPRLPYGVEPVPAYSEKSQTTAYYNPGSIKAARPGIFYANTYDLKSRPRWEMHALTLHEAVPGHHLQIALAQEQTDLHPWRRQLLSFTAFVEGWALYAESLGGEMGFYKDPYSKYGQLTYEMWRAIRLVVDTGMHNLGWSRDKAIKYFEANSAKTRHDIEVEIDRYSVWPGQALAYKMGELKFKELRAYAEDELGGKFDIRTFHDRALEAGPVPLDILERRIKQWVNAVKEQ